MVLVSTSVAALPTAKITIKAIDELGQPIEAAEAGMVLMTPKGRGEGWGTNSGWIPGETDVNGIFSAKGETQAQVSLVANQKGYYGTGFKYDDFTGVSGILGFRKYKPWNPTVELLLKKIINPIPMYAVRMSAYSLRDEYPEMPVLGRFIGFDLTANDWVEPHGLGKHSDFLFKVDVVRAESYRDYDVTLTLKFSNPGDGLLNYTPDVSRGKSQLRFPHHALLTGYKDESVQRYEHTPGVRTIGKGGNPDFETNYFFRVRTELDDEGNVIGGLYGKIHGPIKLGNRNRLHEEEPYVSFNYYLNPNSNDTNIEYDPERNIFKDVPDRLKVSQP